MFAPVFFAGGRIECREGGTGMVTNKRAGGRASSTAAGLAIGAVLSMAITVGGCAVVAWLIARETLREEALGYGVMAVLFLSALIGALVAAGRIKRRRLIMCLASGGIYFLLLIAMTALFFGGQYGAVGATALCVVCGSLVAALANRGQGRSVKRRHKKYASG